MLEMGQGLMARLSARERGQGMVEYALIIALVAVVLIVALTVMKNQISATFSSISNAL